LREWERRHWFSGNKYTNTLPFAATTSVLDPDAAPFSLKTSTVTDWGAALVDVHEKYVPRLPTFITPGTEKRWAVPAGSGVSAMPATAGTAATVNRATSAERV